MEKIIIWVVIMAGALIYEQIKKRARKEESADEEMERTSAPRRQRPRMRPQPPVVLDFEREPERSRAPESPAQRSPRLQTSIVRASRLKPLPTEGESVTRSTAEASGPEVAPTPTTSPVMATSTEEEDRARAAHYDRWRRAIIDTQILERKF